MGKKIPKSSSLIIWKPNNLANEIVAMTNEVWKLNVIMRLC
jgi:hypothetical protein